MQKKVEVQNALMEKMHKKTIRKYQDNTQNVKNALAVLWLSIYNECSVKVRIKIILK